MKTLTLLLFVAAAVAVFGDGIPVSRDLKQVTVESFTIQLSGKQINEVERLRKVTLTEAQQAPLLALYNKTPREISVLSSRWDSCTCEFSVYGIWCRPGEVEIPRGQLEAQREVEEYLARNPVLEEEPEYESDGDRCEKITLILDSAGKVYLDGKEIQESEIRALVNSIYQRSKENPHLKCSLYLDRPPPIDDVTHTRIREIVEWLETHCEARQIPLWVPGFSAE